MKTRQIIGWSFALLCAGIGTLIFFLMYSHRYIGYVFMGLAGCAAVFLLLQMLGRRMKRTAKVLRLIFSIVIGLGMLTAATTGFYIIAEAGGEAQEPCDYLIVLGCAVNDTTPSQMLQYRIDAACEYLRKNPGTQCIVSGGLGQGDSITEAQCMADELTARGIAADRIWLEEQATSTAETIQYVKAMLQEKTGGIPENIGVLSSEFHLFRSQMVAEDMGMAVQTVSAKTERIGLLGNYFIREILAVWRYKLLNI